MHLLNIAYIVIHKIVNIMVRGEHRKYEKKRILF
jgi:hypothetical protein